MSATRPATEFSIGIMPRSASPAVRAPKASSKVAAGTASASGKAWLMARCEFAPRSPWNTMRCLLMTRYCERYARPSVGVLGGAQDIAPLVDFVGQIFFQEHRAGLARLDDACPLEALLHLRVGQCGIDGRGQPRGDLRRRVLGHVHADPGGRFVACEPHLIEGRHVGKLIPALSGDRDAQRLDLVAAGQI